MKKIATLILAVCIAFNTILLFGGCSTEDKPEHLGYVVDKNNLYGIVEPLYGSEVEGFDVDKSIALMQTLGVKSYRFQFMYPSPLIGKNEPNMEVINLLNDIIAKLRKAGIEQIIFAGILKPEGYQGDENAVPERGAPEYGQFLKDYATCWKTFSSLFQDEIYFEMGNEPNMDGFMHKYDYQKDGTSLDGGTGVFTMEEKIDITTDLMYYASKGIHEGNPKAITVSPGFTCGMRGLASKELEYFIEDIYLNIESGEFPYGEQKSTVTDDYFQSLAWHPYLINANSIDENWLAQNNAIYEVVKKHGDDGKKVFFTEMGFSDGGNPDRDEMQAEMFKKVYEYAKNDMPYVESVHAFRLFEAKNAASWGGDVEIYYGMFKEENGGFTPKKKAEVIQQIFGGTGDLNQFKIS